MANLSLRRPLGRRAASLLLGGVLAAVAAGQAFADPPVIARSVQALSPAPGPGNPLLRVLLQQAGVLEPRAYAGPLRLLDGQGRSLMLLSTGERLRISREGEGLRLERPDAVDPRQGAPLRLPLQLLVLESAPEPGSGTDSSAGPQQDRPAVAVAPLRPVAQGEPASRGLVGLGRRAYRGALQVRPEGTSLMAINLIPLEVYLPSVVGSEMPARWPSAALRAQAVAARTYALAQLKPNAPYDLKATVASQAYAGIEAETDSTRAAVAATRAMVLRFGGSLIDAVFHSSSGGSTENSGEMWNRQLPYLVSVPDGDDRSPWREWSLRFDPDQLRRAFRETAGASRIEVLSTSSTGRVRRARVIGPAGSLDLSGGELRQRLGLRSTLVRFRFEEPRAALGPSGSITSATAQANAEAVAAAGSDRPDSWRRFLLPSGADSSPTAPATAARSPVAPPPPPPAPGAAESAALSQTPAREPFPDLPPAAPSLEVIGRGFGHGVGMSQWGAYALALRGSDYGAILRHYYRGAQLVPFAGP